MVAAMAAACKPIYRVAVDLTKLIWKKVGFIYGIALDRRFFKKKLLCNLFHLDFTPIILNVVESLSSKVSRIIIKIG
jgi:hypothetical protein